MKYWFLVGMILLVNGCASETQFGKCIGIAGDKDPKLQYEYSTRNIVLGAMFSGTIFAPIVVALKEIQCPVGVKQ